MMEDRWKRWSWLLFPLLLTAYLYRRSFRIWFLNDDFAWLGLSLSVHDASSLAHALFAPMAQGTIRTLSERLFFLVFERCFGLESLPMRLAMFLTFAACFLLLALTVRRLTGNRAAGAIAALAWSLNFGTTVAMAWLSSYNQILLSALLMGAFYCFLQREQGGPPRWTFGMWACYLLGFGALESMIVFPALVLAWLLLFRPGRWRLAPPLAAPALLFAAAHLFLIPKAQNAPAYRMFFDASILESLAIYWNWFLGAPRLTNFSPDWQWLARTAQWILTPGLLGWILFRATRRDWLPLFGLLMSLLLLSPMLPLRDHRTDYYLASASLGLALSLGTMVARGPAYLVYPLLLLYAAPSFILQQSTFEWYLERTGPLRPLLRGLQQAGNLHPNKQILLDGINDAVYDSALSDDALRLFPNINVRLVPRGGGLPLRTWDLSESIIRSGFAKEAIIVYHFDGVRLRDVTRQWERGRALSLASGLANELRAGDHLIAPQFLDGWFEIEQGRRWMGQNARVRLGYPTPTTGIAAVQAYCPEPLRNVTLEIWQANTRLHRQTLQPGAVDFTFALPPAQSHTEEITLELRLNRTVTIPGDGRKLGLLFGTIRLQ
ncbi:MAG: hypothetical protein K7J46_18790 [Bryobacter sp.]|jgi:hypothetical protein|nr:hypothetical protein [Bryobacter sp. CoA8 C33]